MPGNTHSLMEYASDSNPRTLIAIDDQVRADQIGEVCVRKIVAAVANTKIPAQLPEGLIDLVSIGHHLLLSPSLAGVAQDIDKVLTSPRRKNDVAVALKGGHHDPSAYLNAWRRRLLS